MNPVTTYFEYCREVMLEPRRFFRAVAPRFPLNLALVIGLTSIWIGKIIAYSWQLLSKVFFHSVFDIFSQGLFTLNDLLSYGDTVLETNYAQLEQKNIIWQSASLLLQPFWSLMGIVFSAAVLWVFTKIFINQSNNVNNTVSYRQSIKIVALAAVSSWFLVVPLFGWIFAYFMLMFLTIIGVRESYAISTKRALLVVLTPQLLFFMLFVFLLIILFLFALGGAFQEMFFGADDAYGADSLLKGIKFFF